MATVHTTETRRAYEAAVLPLVDWVQGRALKLTRSPADAEDLAQEVLIRAFRHWGTYDPNKASIKAWLGTVVRNTFCNRYEALNRRRDIQTAHKAEVEITEGPAGGQLEVLEARETVLAVRAAVEALPEEFRTVLVAVDLEGAAYLDAAAALGIPKGTVMSRLHRGRTHLRAALAA
jgi:RNA polymerase sigma-70 factor (ECF subfamily)